MTLCDPMDYSTPDPWNPPGKNTGVGSHSFHHGIFPTQGSNLGLLHCRQILYLLSHQGMVILTSHNHFKKEQSWSFPIHEWGQLFKKKIGIYLAVLGSSCGMWDPLVVTCYWTPQLQHTGSNFQTRYGTWGPHIGSVESQPLDHQGSPGTASESIKDLERLTFKSWFPH